MKKKVTRKIRIQSLKKSGRKTAKALLPVLAAVLMMSVLCKNMASASGEGGGADVLGSLDALKTLFLGIISGIGVIIAAKNGMEMFQAYQQQDSASMNSALKGVIAGVGMAAIGTILTLLGL